MTETRSLRRLRGPVGRLALFALLWLVIAGSDPANWLVGLPTVLLATWVSLRLTKDLDQRERSGMTLVGFARFLPFFLAESLRGGLDVAARVLRPRMNIDPGFQRYRPNLIDPIARVVFLDSISLLPGTLSADMRDGIIEVHALDASADLAPALQRLEQHVGRLFGETQSVGETPRGPLP